MLLHGLLYGRDENTDPIDMAAEQAVATTFVYETAETPEGGRKAADDKASIPDLPGTFTQ